MTPKKGETHEEYLERRRQVERPWVNAPVETGARIELAITDGEVLVGSDAHFVPGPATTAWRSFCSMAGAVDHVVLNGDVIDASTVSRFPRIGWERRPKLSQEIKVAQERLAEIACPNKYWTLGNHDMRFETRLAAVAPEYAGVHGVHLKDHFPEWTPAWAIHINNDVVIKHRWKGGDHAVFNNTVRSGRTIITGHLHRLCVSPYSDYNGTRWGVDTGTLAEPYGEQFIDYTEDGSVNWCSGYVLLTFKDGKLLWPEIIHVVGPDKVSFRGKLWEV